MLVGVTPNPGKMENENVTYHDMREIFKHDGVTGWEEVGALPYPFYGNLRYVCVTSCCK
ncbi:MAG: hypothetical protein NC307_10390 [Roseburia sp.]|nr:hypothetical protein [Roseburia sp.]